MKHFEKPHLPGYVVLGIKDGDNAFCGVVEHSWSMGLSKDNIQFYWSSDNATSNLGGKFKIDGFKEAEEQKKHFEKTHPNYKFMIYDINDPNLPIVIDWDSWRLGNQKADTFSGVRNKYLARNPRFYMKE